MVLAASHRSCWDDSALLPRSEQHLPGRRPPLTAPALASTTHCRRRGTAREPLIIRREASPGNTAAEAVPADGVEAEAVPADGVEAEAVPADGVGGRSGRVDGVDGDRGGGGRGGPSRQARDG